MIKKYDVYEQNLVLDDKYNIAKEIIEQVEKSDIIIEKEPDILKDIIDMDLRENVPPQIYELISCVVDMIEKAEKN